MQPEVKSKRWVDFSDSSCQDDQQTPTKTLTTTQQTHIDHITTHIKQSNIHASQSQSQLSQQQTSNFIQNQLAQLDSINIDQVWIVLNSTDKQYLAQQINHIRASLHKSVNIFKVYRSNVGWQVLIAIGLAYKLTKSGYDSTGKMNLTISEYNFKKTQQKPDSKYEEYSEQKTKQQYQKGKQQEEQSRPRKKFQQKPPRKEKLQEVELNGKVELNGQADNNGKQNGSTSKHSVQKQTENIKSGKQLQTKKGNPSKTKPPSKSGTNIFEYFQSQDSS